MTMAVSVVIATRNNAQFLNACLCSLMQEKGKLFEIIVVDDCSTDGTKSKIAPFTKHNRVSYYQLKKHRGASFARNYGAKKSTGTYLFFIDADTQVRPGWVKQIAAFFRLHKDSGAGQVKLIRKGTNRFDSAGDLLSNFGFLAERARYAIDKGQFDTQEYIFSGKSAGMIVRADLFDTLGGFDEEYRIFLEDTDFFWRVWLSGHSVYFVPSVVVFHAYGTTEKSKQYYVDNKVYRRGCANALTTYIKNIGGTRLLFLLPLHVVVRIVLSFAFLLSGSAYRSKELLLGIKDAAVSLPASLRKRKYIQEMRVVSDRQLFEKIGVVQPFSFYTTKIREFIGEKKY